MTLTDLSTAADTISQRDAYDRVALIRTEDEAASLYRGASESGDVDLMRALVEAALWNDWTLDPESPTLAFDGFARLEH